MRDRKGYMQEESDQLNSLLYSRLVYIYVKALRLADHFFTTPLARLKIRGGDGFKLDPNGPQFPNGFAIPIRWRWIQMGHDSQTCFAIPVSPYLKCLYQDSWQCFYRGQTFSCTFECPFGRTDEIRKSWGCATQWQRVHAASQQSSLLWWHPNWKTGHLENAGEAKRSDEFTDVFRQMCILEARPFIVYLSGTAY